ncbi:hypothetical protein R6Q59_031909 [Mikania micrantha]
MILPVLIGGIMELVPSGDMDGPAGLMVIGGGVIIMDGPVGLMVIGGGVIIMDGPGLMVIGGGVIIIDGPGLMGIGGGGAMGIGDIDGA